jgi:hypothetical protein
MPEMVIMSMLKLFKLNNPKATTVKAPLLEQLSLIKPALLTHSSRENLLNLSNKEQ